MNKPLLLQDVNIGSFFEFKGLENHFRGLQVQRSNDCSVLIDGEIKDPDKGWKPLGANYTVSPAS
ncbi:MAG TPA: hypothetical protein VMW91_11320, partial [Desulfosporosinus sp.]|nr:hypothetical protein [Desulfosporosinus sp.]